MVTEVSDNKLLLLLVHMVSVVFLHLFMAAVSCGMSSSIISTWTTFLTISNFPIVQLQVVFSYAKRCSMKRSGNDLH